jgi:hypothetical protein
VTLMRTDIFGKMLLSKYKARHLEVVG